MSITDYDDPDDYLDDDPIDDYLDDEWREGECDRCSGQTVLGALGPIYCACSIGRGAPEDECLCGPVADSAGVTA